jgi:NADH:ubiquinone oxidoreductase subunit E
MTDLKICVGSACHLKGSNDVIEIFKNCVHSREAENDVVIKGAFCLGHCTEAVSVCFNDKIYSINTDTAEKFFDEVVMEHVRRNQ